MAEAAGNETAIKELKALAPYPPPDGTNLLQKLSTERKWSVGLGGLGFGRSSFGWYGNLFELSPEYSTADIDAILQAIGTVNAYVIGALRSEAMLRRKIDDVGMNDRIALEGHVGSPAASWAEGDPSVTASKSRLANLNAPGRIAQRESARFTRERSLVRSQVRPSSETG